MFTFINTCLLAACLSVTFFTEFCLLYICLRPSGSSPALYLPFFPQIESPQAAQQQSEYMLNLIFIVWIHFLKATSGDKYRTAEQAHMKDERAKQAKRKHHYAGKENIKRLKTFLSKAVYDKWHFVSETKQLQSFIIQSFVCVYSYLRSECISYKAFCQNRFSLAMYTQTMLRTDTQMLSHCNNHLDATLTCTITVLGWP